MLLFKVVKKESNFLYLECIYILWNIKWKRNDICNKSYKKIVLEGKFLLRRLRFNILKLLLLECFWIKFCSKVCMYVFLEWSKMWVVFLNYNYYILDVVVLMVLDIFIVYYIDIVGI